MKISVVSGGFDPIHSGHISYINAAKKYGDYLIIALNSDEWLKQKKGKEFMPFEERKSILENIKNVGEDEKTVNKLFVTESTVQKIIVNKTEQGIQSMGQDC